MIDRNPRNIRLPIGEKNPFRETLVPAFFAAGVAFDRDIEAIAQDNRLSPEGRREKVKARRQEALDNLTDLQKPIDDYRKQTESMRSGIKQWSFDKTDLVAAMN